MTTTTRYAVTGMTCEHCVRAVTDELSDLPGVAGVEVHLVPGGDSVVALTTERPVDEGLLCAAVAEAGYVLTGVTR